MKSQEVQHQVKLQAKRQAVKNSSARDSIVKLLCTTVILVAFGTAAMTSGAADPKPTDAKPTDAKPTDAKPTDAKPTGISTPAGISTPSGAPDQKGLIGKKEKAKEKEKEKKDTNGQSGRLVPFHGKLDSVDKVAKSIKSGERTFQVMPATKITKDGVQPGTLDDAKVGETIGGAYREGEGGSYQLVSLRLGPKPEKKTAAGRKK